MSAVVSRGAKTLFRSKKRVPCTKRHKDTERDPKSIASFACASGHADLKTEPGGWITVGDCGSSEGLAVKLAQRE